MREMLKMPCEHLIGHNLVEKVAGFALNGPSMNVALEGLVVVQEDLLQIQDLQRLCLSSILIHIILGGKALRVI